METRMGNPIGFVFLILTTSQLIIRPHAFNPALSAIPFFQLFILPCLIFSVPGCLQQLTGESVSRNPITAYLLGFTLVHFFSAIINVGPSEGFSLWAEFLKVLIYYLLVLANIRNYRHLLIYGISYTLFMLVSACVAMANYYKLVDMPGYKQLGEYAGYDLGTATVLYNFRLSGPTGSSSGDPNDFCLMMLPAIFLSGHLVLTSRSWLVKLLSLVPFVTLLQAMRLTQSRGGMLGFLVGITAYIWIRYGFRRSIPLLVLGAVGFLAMAGGRQTDFSMKSGSGHVRIQIWLTCINLIKGSPVFGVGPGKLLNYSHLVAHNSYLHALTELGFLGGMCFIGIFFSAFWCIYRMHSSKIDEIDPRLWILRPTMIAILISTATSMNALSRTYTNETFAVIGFASAYYHILSDQYRDTPVRTSFRLSLVVGFITLAFLVMIRIQVLRSF
jgi:hypothetical protein